MAQTRTSETLLIGVYYTETSQKNKAEQLAKSLDLPIVQDTTGYDYLLCFVDDRLSLYSPDKSVNQGRIFVEFVKGAAGYRRKHGKKEMLLKAIGFRKNHPLRVLDATGGLGKDAFQMAGNGCEVHIFERNRIVAALLKDGLQRAYESPETNAAARRIQLSIIDSCQFITESSYVKGKYDVIYLDPMFPERSKSALVKKEMQMLQKLLGYEDDTEQLFQAALETAGKRVVVKRPKTAPSLKGIKPSHSISGKTTRFDVYII